MPRPTAAELEAARAATVPDVIADGLDILFCGINPGLYSAHTGHHFARPGNRFWPALHRAGLTPRQLRPEEQHLLPRWGMGITNLVARATARADELTARELTAGGTTLRDKLTRHRPRLLAVLGVGAYRTAFAAPRARVGLQPGELADTPVWVLPNPSGLNAHWSLAAIATELDRMRRHTLEPGGHDPCPP